MRTAEWLVASGLACPPRVAQEAMRHSGIDLTMNVYTDPNMLDVARAVELLPLRLHHRLHQLQGDRGNSGQFGATLQGTNAHRSICLRLT